MRIAAILWLLNAIQMPIGLMTTMKPYRITQAICRTVLTDQINVGVVYQPKQLCPPQISKIKFLSLRKVFKPMRIQIAVVIYLIIFAVAPGYALEPEQILIIANSDVLASVQIAQYYCSKRDVPIGNILALPLGTSLGDAITRNDYEKFWKRQKKMRRLQVFIETLLHQPDRCLINTINSARLAIRRLLSNT